MIELIKSIVSLILTLWPFWSLALVPVIAKIIYYYIKYKRSKYRFESGVRFIRFYFDKGYFGEALTFMELEKIDSHGKIMTNLYIPTENETTEIDLLYISSYGVYVIESKNYSGWILGNDNSKYWTKVIYNYKTKFFNPIWQNKKHIKYLQKLIDVPMTSLIVFSERCRLKKLRYNKNESFIINRQDLVNYIKSNKKDLTVIQDETINEIYYLLSPYKLKSNDEKEKHINYINKIK